MQCSALHATSSSVIRPVCCRFNAAQLEVCQSHWPAQMHHARGRDATTHMRSRHTCDQSVAQALGSAAGSAAFAAPTNFAKSIPWQGVFADALSSDIVFGCYSQMHMQSQTPHMPAPPAVPSCPSTSWARGKRLRRHSTDGYTIGGLAKHRLLATCTCAPKNATSYCSHRMRTHHHLHNSLQTSRSPRCRHALLYSIIQPV